MEDEIKLYSVAFSDHTFIGIPADQVSSEDEAIEAAREVRRVQGFAEYLEVTLVELITLK